MDPCIPEIFNINVLMMHNPSHSEEHGIEKVHSGEFSCFLQLGAFLVPTTVTWRFLPPVIELDSSLPAVHIDGATAVETNTLNPRALRDQLLCIMKCEPLTIHPPSQASNCN